MSTLDEIVKELRVTRRTRPLKGNLGQSGYVWLNDYGEKLLAIARAAERYGSMM